MLEYSWPGNIRELENLVKRYVIVGNEAQIIRELSTHKPIMSSRLRRWLHRRLQSREVPQWSAPSPRQQPFRSPQERAQALRSSRRLLLEIGRRAAMLAEREAIERVLTQTRWNRRQAAKILKISYKALLNKLKANRRAECVSK